MDWHNVVSIGLACTVSLILTACSAESESVARTVAEPSPLFVLSPDGVGPLNASTPFNLVRIGEAFQDLNVAEETYFQEGGQFQTITVRQQVKPLLSINPDHKQQGIFSVVVHDNLVSNKLGHTIGTRFADIYSFGKTEECGSGMEEWAGKVMCFAPETDNILYLFNGKWDGPDDQMPPLTVLADWQLEAMVWRRPSPPPPAAN